MHSFSMKRVVASSSVAAVATCDVEGTVVAWRRDVELIRKMRKDMIAPVDTMGCHKLADPLAAPPVCVALGFINKTQRFLSQKYGIRS